MGAKGGWEGVRNRESRGGRAGCRRGSEIGGRVEAGCAGLVVVGGGVCGLVVVRIGGKGKGRR